jgi:RNA polymerase sigma-70 factor, ECF subfamily
MSDVLRRLLDAVKHGDDVAAHRFVVETQPIVYRLCSALGSHGAVDDLVQETYLRAFRSIDSYRGEAPVKAWLLSIARHVCADDVRRRQRSRRLVERVTRFPIATNAQAPGTPIDDLLEALDPDRREALLLTQYLGLAYEEAAVVLGCPVGTVRSRVARARADLMRIWRIAEAQ